VNQAVTVRLAPAPRQDPDTILTVAQALLPLLPWRGVPVLREKRQELTMMERFVLEMGLALGSVEPEDFAEITSLPPSALAGATWRLISSGILSPHGGSYGIHPERAATALQQRTVARLVRSSADFVLLPRSGDLLGVAGRDGGWLRALEQGVVPDRKAPLPPSLRAATRAAYLGGKVQAKAVPGLDSDVVGVPPPEGDDPRLVPEPKRGDSQWLPVCPAYLCRAEVRRTDSGTCVVEAVIFGRARHGGRKVGGQKNGPDAEVRIDLTGASGLITGWLKLADALNDPQTLQAAWRMLGPTSNAFGRPPLDGAHHRGTSEWELLVNGNAARGLCEQRRPMAEPRGLAIEADGVVIHISCHFLPTDDEARALFARDEVVSRLLATHTPVQEFLQIRQDAVRRLPEAGGVLSADSVRERIWQLGHYHLVYMLRELEDFPYD